jgi:hypothetical protein
MSSCISKRGRKEHDPGAKARVVMGVSYAGTEVPAYHRSGFFESLVSPLLLRKA